MPLVSDILSSKGSSVVTIGPATGLIDAVHAMNEHKCGALVVMDVGRVAGMFTERDILVRVLGAGVDPSKVTVADVMTKNVVCCRSTDDLDDVARLMKDRRIRHVPVCDPSGELMGMISIGDLNAFHVSHHEQTISQLNDYIYGRA